MVGESADLIYDLFFTAFYSKNNLKDVFLGSFGGKTSNSEKKILGQDF